MTTADRESLGLAGLDNPERRAWGTALDEAKAEGLGNADRALADAAELIQKPRALNDKETAGLVIAASDLKKQHAAVMDRMKADPEGALFDAAELQRIEDQFDTVTQALRKSGTEKGRALAAQKLTLNQDLELVSVLNRAKAYKGSSLTAKERAGYEKLIGEYKAKAEAHEMRVRELEAKAAEQVIQRQPGRRKLPPKEHAAKTADLVANVRKLLEAGCS